MRKNVAGQNVAAQVNSRTDGSPLTSAVSVLVTIDNGTQTAGGGTTAHKGNGQWNYAPTQAETNGNHLAFVFTHATGVNQTVNVYTISFDPHDTVRLGLTALPNATAGGTGGLPIVGTGTNNFKSDASANVTVGTNNDKTGYSLNGTQTFNNTGTWTGNITGSVGSVTSAVTVGTNNDKTGYSLSAAGIQGIWDALTSALTTANSIGQGLARFVVYGFYQNGSVWIDTVNGSAGSTTGINGTNRNPVNNMTDANTLAVALGISRFEVAPGSSVTFAATQSNQIFNAIGATLALGGQDISSSTINGAVISGIATGTLATFEECTFLATTLGASSRLRRCNLAGTITLGAAGIYILRDCVTAVIGGTPATIDCGAAVGNTTVNLRNYSGHVEVQNLGQLGTDEFYMEGVGDLTVNANCINNALVTLRGIIGLTNNGTVTLDQAQRITNTQIADYVWDEILAGHLGAGSTGAALNAAGAAGDPWSTSIPGAYGAGTAGYIVGNNLDATVSSRLATAGYTAPDNATIASIDGKATAIKAKTDQLTFTKANELDANVQSVNDVTIVGDGSGTPFNV